MTRSMGKDHTKIILLTYYAFLTRALSSRFWVYLTQLFGSTPTQSWSAAFDHNVVFGPSADPFWCSRWTAATKKDLKWPKAETRHIFTKKNSELAVSAHLSLHPQHSSYCFEIYLLVGGDLEGQEGAPRKLRSNLFSCRPLEWVFVWFASGTCAAASGSLMWVC